jgi:hypothetical protein
MFMTGRSPDLRHLVERMALAKPIDQDDRVTIRMSPKRWVRCAPGPGAKKDAVQLGTAAFGFGGNAASVIAPRRRSSASLDAREPAAGSETNLFYCSVLAATALRPRNIIGRNKFHCIGGKLPLIPFASLGHLDYASSHHLTHNAGISGPGEPATSFLDASPRIIQGKREHLN